MSEEEVNSILLAELDEQIPELEQDCLQDVLKELDSFVSKPKSLASFLSSTPANPQFKSFNKNDKKQGMTLLVFSNCLTNEERYISKKEWVLLENCFKITPSPSNEHLQILAAVLGAEWPLSKIQTWFQHQRQNLTSKYKNTEISTEDKVLWHQVKQLWTMSEEQQLAVHLSQCKARAANYLQNCQKDWEDQDFTISGKELKTLQNLKLAYTNKYECKSDDEMLLDLFDVEIESIPIVSAISEAENSNNSKLIR